MFKIVVHQTGSDLAFPQLKMQEQKNAFACIAKKYNRENEGEARGRQERDTAGEQRWRVNIYLGHSKGRISFEWLAEKDNSPQRWKAGNVLIGSFSKWSLLLATNWDGGDCSAAWENVTDLQSTSVSPGATAMATAGLKGPIRLIKVIQQLMKHNNVIVFWGELSSATVEMEFF